MFYSSIFSEYFSEVELFCLQTNVTFCVLFLLLDGDVSTIFYIFGTSVHLLLFRSKSKPFTIVVFLTDRQGLSYHGIDRSFSISELNYFLKNVILDGNLLEIKRDVKVGIFVWVLISIFIPPQPSFHTLAEIWFLSKVNGRGRGLRQYFYVCFTWIA